VLYCLLKSNVAVTSAHTPFFSNFEEYYIVLNKLKSVHLPSLYILLGLHLDKVTKEIVTNYNKSELLCF